MADNIHPVVELLAARMESHPEEFGHTGNGRWGEITSALYELATPEEKALLRRKRMDELHEAALDELLNGEQRRAERRAEEQRTRDLEMQRLLAQAQAVQAVQGSLQNNLSSAMVQQYQNAGLNIRQDYLHNSLLLGSGKSKVRVPMEDVEDHGLVGSIKKALGLK